MKEQEYFTCVSLEEIGTLQENWKQKISKCLQKQGKLVIESKVIIKAWEFGLDLVVQTR